VKEIKSQKSSWEDEVVSRVFKKSVQTDTFHEVLKRQEKTGGGGGGRLFWKKSR